MSAGGWREKEGEGTNRNMERQLAGDSYNLPIMEGDIRSRNAYRAAEKSVAVFVRESALPSRKKGEL
jgi:hypothetical protein